MEESTTTTTPAPAPATEADYRAAIAMIQADVATLKSSLASAPLEPAEPLEVRSLMGTYIQHRSLPDTLLALLTSRKFLLLLLDTTISLTMHYNAAPPEIIAILQPVFIAIILGIAHEDAAAKSSPQSVQVQEVSQ